ncbi:MAG: hypothetical protein KF801_08100 [Cryobacterium sp.]|nr:hypothetical protein [Cryobacterium sp.]
MRKLELENGPLALYLGLVMAVAIMAFSPGLLNADSIDMLNQSVTGRYHDWHSPLMTLAWSLLGHVKPGPAPMLVMELLLFVVGTYLILARVFRSAWIAIGAATLIILLPPIFGSLGVVNKDMLGLSLFATMIGLFGADLAHRKARLAVAWVAFGVLMCAVRTDYLPFFFWACAARIWVSLSWRLPKRSTPADALMIVGAVAVSIVAALIFALATAISIGVVNYGALGADRRYPIQATLLHDIAGVSVAHNDNLYPSWIKNRGVTLEAIRKRYATHAGDPLFWGGEPRVPFASSPAEFMELRGAWLMAVGSNPKAYLRHRLAVIACLVKSCTSAYGHFQYATDPRYGNLVDYDRMGLNEPIAGANMRAGYLKWAAGTVLARAPLYIVSLFLCMSLLLAAPWASRPRVPSPVHDHVRTVSGALGLGAASHLLVLGLLTPAANFRYLTPTIFVAAILLLYALFTVCESQWPIRIASAISRLNHRARN